MLSGDALVSRRHAVGSIALPCAEGWLYPDITKKRPGRKISRPGLENGSHGLRNRLLRHHLGLPRHHGEVPRDR